MKPELLAIAAPFPLRAANAGLFVCRGRGIHPTRTMDSFELIVVRKGVLSMAEEDRQFEVHPGQTLVLWPGRLHRGTKDYPPDLSFYWLHFFLEKRAAARRATISVPQTATLRDDERLIGLLRRFLDDQEAGRLEPLSASLLVMLMLWEVANASNAPANPTGSAASLAGRVERLISTRFHEPISTADIARRLDCNADYLGRVFRRCTGQTIIEAIHRRRLRSARHLLVDSSRNVDEIAAECGFDDTRYFRRIFRKYEGMAPLAYRRLYARMHVNTE